MRTSFRGLLPLALSTLFVYAAVAQTAPVPARVRTGFESVSQANLRADEAFLTSDALAGRLSLQPGDEAAIKWIASEFKKDGLTPPFNGSYLQPVPLVEYHPDRKASAVTLMRSGKSTTWNAPNVTGAYRDNVDLSAPVVFAGYGITAPELHYDDYAHLDAKGKIVLIFDHEPQEDDPTSIFNGTGNTRYATARVKALNAQAHGAIAVLIVAEPNRKHPTGQERASRIGSPRRAIPLPTQAIANDLLHIPSVTITDVVAAQLLATAGATPSALQSSIDAKLESQSRALPNTVATVHLANSSRTTGTTQNVGGLLQGSDPTLASETILISGHHDHDGMSGTDIWHGADDNASGTTGVVELARAFTLNKARPKRSILFVVFASEERGLLGAYYMAAHPVRPLATTRAMINFDMIGRNEAPSPQTDGLIQIPADTTNRLNLIGAPYSPDYLHAIQQQNKLVGLTLDDRFDHESALNVFFRSDQFPFVLHNVPAFWWFTGFHPDYHHPTDTAEKINYVKMQKILRLAYLTAWSFGDGPKPPAFIANPFPKGH